MKMRMTTQRIKIIEYLQGTKEHPTAEMVFEVTKKELPAITLATVYRNLNMMTSNGEVVRIEANGEYRFDADTSSHQHCVCKKCGKVTDLFEKNIKCPIDALHIEGFNPEYANVMIYGTCKNCSSKKGD